MRKIINIEPSLTELLKKIKRLQFLPQSVHVTSYSKHRPISYRFRDKRLFRSKVAKFSHHRVFKTPVKGFWNFVTMVALKTNVMPVPDRV